MIRDAALRIAERGGRLGAPLHLLETTESTNDDAKKGAAAGDPHGATWVAESQSKGRGRQGRIWQSPRGENLMFSVLLRVQCPPPRVPPLALVVGLAVRDAIAAVLPNPDAVKVKWPNDVLVHQKKISGILLESQIAGQRVESLVVGVGVNVHTRDFPPELNATSVSLEGGQAERATLLADILARLDHDIEHVVHRGLGLVHDRLTRHDALAGRDVSVDGISGTASGIDPDGRLLIRDREGILHHVTSGEVTPTSRAPAT